MTCSIKGGVVSLVVLLLLAGCGGGGGDNNLTGGPKDLFSLWNDTVDGTPVDLTNGAFNTPMLFVVQFPDGEVCECDFTLNGTQDSGTYSLNSCVYKPSTGSGVDPNCNDLNDTGTYSKTSKILTTCDSSMDCTTYD